MEPGGVVPADAFVRHVCTRPVGGQNSPGHRSCQGQCVSDGVQWTDREAITASDLRSLSTEIVGVCRYDSLMSSIGLVDRQHPPVAGAVCAALIELTRVVDVLQAGSLDGLDDHEVLAVFRDLEAQRRRLPTVDHRLITELECRGTASKLLARGTAGLLTELLHVDVGEAKARVRAAGVLGARTSITGDHWTRCIRPPPPRKRPGRFLRSTPGSSPTIGALPHHLDEDTVASAERTLGDPGRGLTTQRPDPP